MRIIAGKYRSRPLLTPPDAETTRPIPDRVKESLFGILRGHFEGASVLDAFAGTGSIGLEALSRGAARVVFVERDRRAADLLERNIELLGAGDECDLVRGDALGPALLNQMPRPVDLAFFDPPYPLVLEAEGWERVQRQLSRVVEQLTETGFLVLRTPWPFRHVEAVLPDGSTEPVKPDPRGGVRPKVPTLADLEDRSKTKHRRTQDAERAWEGDRVDLDEIRHDHEADMDALAHEMASDEPLPILKHDVVLTLPGADGPETHAYSTTAVHLYMRKRTPGTGS